ncbi:MAG: PSD1 and planctomycete cytochrome C domain-containing protein [Verrucomicrobiales bacterium]
MKQSHMNVSRIRALVLSLTVMVLAAHADEPEALKATVPATSASAAVPHSPDFSTQIRPVLSTYCFACHGPDEAKRKAGMRLDTQAGAIARNEDGRAAVVPGDAAASMLLTRLTASDMDERMPPEGKPGPSAAEQSLLRQWIAAGAPYAEHWAFVAPRRPGIPAVKDTAWARSDLDRFVLASLEAQGLKPQAEATRETLIRRVSLDLTGIPPTLAEIDAFVADRAADAYERVVDRLLALPRYGERLATPWLDAARYADSHGFQQDEERSMWRWRDWVIEAYNADMPFDRFTLLQMAGDLLPDASPQTILATGFHRNHRLSSEGGIDAEEFRLEGVFDRAETTATVWLGLTMNCARCHDHKYAPILQKDYYRFAAYFDSIEESGIRGVERVVAPILRLPSPEEAERTTALVAAVTAAEKELAALKSATPPTAPAALAAAQSALNDAKKSRDDFAREVSEVMVLKDRAEPRETYVLKRGEYGHRGERVEAGTPGFLPPLPAGAPGNRLALARWLVDPANPLTARVQVNRFWEMLSGTGLVATLENFGGQAEPPSNAALLDWLAVEFRDQGWSTKRLLRTIVTSATYRQSAIAPAELIACDPANRLLARGPRFRMTPEMLRDQALAASGLLVEHLGGPAIRPYEPASSWDGGQGSGNLINYTPATDEGLWRRGVYVIWKRTQPPPSMVAFDAPSREFCSVQRLRTNTPLQALAMFNNVTTSAAARMLAVRIMGEAATPEERLILAMRHVVARRPDAHELEILTAGLNRRLARYAADTPAAQAVLAVGTPPPPTAFPPAELAAYAQTCALILNLDETLTRE